MRKRLKKKLHKGEYTCYGFEIVIDLSSTKKDIDKIYDEFIDFI